MPKLTEEMLVDALDLSDAKEFFDILNASAAPSVQPIIEHAWASLAVMILSDAKSTEDFIRMVVAAQWSAFSAGWALRGYADGKS